MALLEVDIDPLKALEIFYEGETLGFWEGDFIKAEKKYSVRLPEPLKKYLAKYGQLNVNRGGNQLWIPGLDDIKSVKVNDGIQIVYIVGKFRGNLVAIYPDDYKNANPRVLLSDLASSGGESSTMLFRESGMDLRKLLTNIIIDSPPINNIAEVWDDRDGLSKALDALNLGKARNEVEKAIQEHRDLERFLCWNEQQRYFIGIVFLDDRIILLKFRPCLAVQELESIFAWEFYENSEKCDFRHTLNIMEKLIQYYEKENVGTSILAEKYRLAGRSAWALGEWEKAENYYQKAEQFYDNELNSVLTRVENFYEGLGNFYYDRNNHEKSEMAYEKVDQLCKFAGKNGTRLKGNRLVRRAMGLMDANQPEKALELYNQALDVYSTDPKDCRYDIARCQQLRGEAKRALKA